MNSSKNITSDLPLLLLYPGNESLGHKIQKILGLEQINFTLRKFPDQETYLRILSEVKGKEIWVLCSLNQPDDKFLPLFFLAQTLRELQAKSIGLIAPYLSYLRQDKRFQPGEALTSQFFASLLSETFDRLITVDPHLHRYHSLDEIYKIPNRVMHATGPITKWIGQNISNPLIIGPDAESEQWVTTVAQEVKGNYVVLEKIRKGDREVEVSLPSDKMFRDNTPVLLDDIISSAQTMKKGVELVLKLGMPAPICIGTHAVMNQETYQDLLNSGAEKVITCNTIAHPSNEIDLSETIVEAIKFFTKK
jgi:ribose-phosphate pyrophosphokinase